jgi:hypothetical protein
MKRFLSAASVLILAATAGMSTWADERVDHFEGEPAETLEQAVANFSEYNALLAELVAQDELSDADLVRVHELTYTLENALGKINSELADLSVTLESVHLASEALDAGSVQSHGRKYLETAAKVIR